MDARGVGNVRVLCPKNERGTLQIICILNLRPYIEPASTPHRLHRPNITSRLTRIVLELVTTSNLISEAI